MAIYKAKQFHIDIEEQDYPDANCTFLISLWHPPNNHATRELIAIGNTTVDLITTVNVTGQQINLANNPVSVISWNPIPPGVNQVWVPIDPDP